MSDSTIKIPHKIGSEAEFAALCAALLKEAERKAHAMKVELTVTIEVPEEGVVFHVEEFKEKRVPRLQERIQEIVAQQIPSQGTVTVTVKHQQTAEERAARQKEWNEQFDDHSECPHCGTACEMLFVEE